METNRTPTYDASENPTGCCPRFKPEGWSGQDLHFENKLFARVKTHSFLHIPLNMGAVFSRTEKAIKQAHAQDEDQFFVLSRDLSPWSSEHLFSVANPVPALEQVRLSGDYRTAVFQGPFRDAPRWESKFAADLAAHGDKAGKIYLFYTTCPKCAKVYGANYVVAVAELANKNARP